ncbi:LysR substrate-binding domain-containing protein [Dyella marensis]|uniref:DNA-binding transcriptional regulator, LysR family n=1 Tax=Dyella marensis TaxID=500610 RepID=A0A1I1WUP1_9GAMM|nr:MULTISPECIES: LysR substrate-binding domain-containing protein [Dyella]SFD98731.1 DNA-binding transcriptional regulator, LysR family [Dyella marensis]
MDRLEVMTMLLAAVDRGSLSAAARALQIPVSTLTRNVTQLEDALGTRLLIRTTRKLALTDAGTAYVAAARRILDQVDEQERDAKGEFTTPRGELVITTPVQFGRLHVLPVINAFLAQFPAIKVSLIQSDRNIDLIDARVDLAVRIGKLPDSSLVATRVGALRAVVCASPGFLATHGVPQHPEDLARVPCVVFNSPYLSPWRFRMPGSNEPTIVAVNPRLEVTAPDSATDACVAGLGPTLLLEHDVAEAVAAGRLRVILSQFEVEPVPVHMVHVSRNVMPMKLRRFIDFAAPRLRESLAHFGKTP